MVFPRGLVLYGSTFFKPENISPLKEEEQQLCEGLVSGNECLSALKEFKNAKSPGTDGYSAEFYKLFWPELGSEWFPVLILPFGLALFLLVKDVESYR